MHHRSRTSELEVLYFRLLQIVLPVSEGPGPERKMPVELKILVGTMTGTAETVAQEVQQALEAVGYRVAVELMDDKDASVFQGGSVFLICTSTYGSGDVPDNARQLYESLQSEKPDLSGIVFGVIALGDRTYKDTYCEGGIRFEKILLELGARRAGEMLKHDASSGTLPEEVASQWALQWAEQHLSPMVEAMKR
jgi:MioC protein